MMKAKPDYSFKTEEAEQDSNVAQLAKTEEKPALPADQKAELERLKGLFEFLPESIKYITSNKPDAVLAKGLSFLIYIWKEKPQISASIPGTWESKGIAGYYFMPVETSFDVDKYWEHFCIERPMKFVDGEVYKADFNDGEIVYGRYDEKINAIYVTEFTKHTVDKYPNATFTLMTEKG